MDALCSFSLKKWEEKEIRTQTEKQYKEEQSGEALYSVDTCTLGKQPRAAIYCDVRQENKHDKHERKPFQDKLELTDLF